MKNFIMMMFALLFSVVLSANANEKKLTFDKIQVEAPCRIITYSGDSIMINIRNNVYDLYYELKDDVLYIKPTHPLNEQDYFAEDVPVIRIAVPKIPVIKASNSLTIVEKTIQPKKIKDNNDVASIN